VVVVEYRKILAILLILMLITFPLSIGLIYIHDNPANVTPISSINSGMTQIGTNVTVKGNITSGYGYLMGTYIQVATLTDESGNLTFSWADSLLEIGWIVIVKGTVYTNYSLHPTSSVELVILFP